jgi:hypothetical protein
LPFSASVLDANNDGRADLVVAEESGNAIGVLLGNGNGSFQPQVTLAAGTTPASVATGDVNGDGRADVVVGNYGSNSVGIFLGNGNGSFQAQRSFGVGALPFAVAALDANLDGRLDVAVSNGGAGTVSVLLGDASPVVTSIARANPAGSLTSNSTVSFTVTFNEPVTGVDSADFKVVSDGSVSASQSVAVSGSGSIYTVTVNGMTGVGTVGVDVVDNGSIKDAVGNPLQPGGIPRFQPLEQFVAGKEAFSITSADVNRDGRVDAIIVRRNQNALSVLLGNGDGSFQNPITIATGLAPYGAAVADVNGDGISDILVPNAPDDAVGILLGNGNGTFQAQKTVLTGLRAISIVTSDVNRDGKADAIVASFEGGWVGVFLGNGNGTFQTQRTWDSGLGTAEAIVADVNGDGHIDVLVRNSVFQGLVSVLLGNGDGTFKSRQTFAAGNYPDSFTSGDVNGDGRLDLVVRNSQGPTSARVLLGNGDGSFQTGATFEATSVLASIAVADVTGDGAADILEGDNRGPIYVLAGNGDGTFKAPISFAAYSNALRMTVSDVNGDGRPDLLAARQNANPNGMSTLEVLLGSANGDATGQTFAVVPVLKTVEGTTGQDRITLGQDPDHVHIDWSFGTTTAQILINDPAGLTINGNGSNDIIVTDTTNGNPLPGTLHLNGTFTIGLSAGTPLTGTLEIGQSTVYVGYFGGPNSAALVQQWLVAGYNGGAWNGTPVGSSGAITSSAAAGGPTGVFGIGYADWADGVVNGQPSNTVEIRYTVMGDTNLDRLVNAVDAVTMARNYLIAGKTAWDLGNFNYDATINLSDAMILQKNFNATATGSVVAATVAAVGAAASVPGGSVTTSSASGSVSQQDSAGDQFIPVGNDGVAQERRHKEKVKRAPQAGRGRR